MGLATFNEINAIVEQFNFTSADTSNSKSVTTSRTQQARIDSMVVTNTDTIAHVVNVFSKTAGGVENLLGSVSVPAGAGTLGTPGVDVLAGSLPATQSGLLIPALTFVSAGMAVTIGTGHVWVTSYGGTL